MTGRREDAAHPSRRKVLKGALSGGGVLTRGAGVGFADKFREIDGYVPTYQAAFSGILPSIYQEALRDAAPADPFNPGTLRQRLAKLNLKDTIWGPVSFDGKGPASVVMPRRPCNGSAVRQRPGSPPPP